MSLISLGLSGRCYRCDSHFRGLTLRGIVPEPRDTRSNRSGDQLHPGGTDIPELGGQVYGGHRDVYGQRRPNIRL